MRIHTALPARRPPAPQAHSALSMDCWGSLPPAGAGRFWLGVARLFPGGWPWNRFALLARRLARRHLADPVDVRVWGLALRLFPHRSVSESRILFMPRSWDRAERRWLARRLSPGFHFVDVGANVGGYAFWVLSRTGPGSRIVAIEPNPGLARQLRFNIAANGAHDRVAVVDAAVSDRSGTGRLTVNEANSGENRLVSHPAEPEAGRIPPSRRSSLDPSGNSSPNPATASGPASSPEAGSAPNPESTPESTPRSDPESSPGSNPASSPESDLSSSFPSDPASPESTPATGHPSHPPPDGTVSVPVLTLAEVVAAAGLERIDCLKVDVEGHEARVIRPFIESAPVSLWPRLLIVEMKRPKPVGPAPAARDSGHPASAQGDSTRPNPSDQLAAWLLRRGYKLELRTRLNGLFRLDSPTPSDPAA